MQRGALETKLAAPKEQWEEESVTTITVAFLRHVLRKYLPAAGAITLNSVFTWANSLLTFPATLMPLIKFTQNLSAPWDRPLNEIELKELHQLLDSEKTLINTQENKIIDIIQENTPNQRFDLNLDFLTELMKWAHSIEAPVPQQFQELAQEISNFTKNPSATTIANIIKICLNQMRKDAFYQESRSVYLTVCKKILRKCSFYKIDKFIGKCTLQFSTKEKFNELYLGKEPCLIKEGNGKYTLWGYQQGEWKRRSIDIPSGMIEVLNHWVDKKLVAYSSKSTIAFYNKIIYLLMENHDIVSSYHPNVKYVCNELYKREVAKLMSCCNGQMITLLQECNNPHKLVTLFFSCICDREDTDILTQPKFLETHGPSLLSIIDDTKLSDKQKSELSNYFLAIAMYIALEEDGKDYEVKDSGFVANAIRQLRIAKQDSVLAHLLLMSDLSQGSGSKLRRILQYVDVHYQLPKIYRDIESFYFELRMTAIYPFYLDIMQKTSGVMDGSELFKLVLEYQDDFCAEKKHVILAECMRMSEGNQSRFFVPAPKLAYAGPSHSIPKLIAMETCVKLKYATQAIIEKIKNSLNNRLTNRLKHYTDDPVAIADCFKRLPDILATANVAKSNVLDSTVKQISYILEPLCKQYVMISGLFNNISAVLDEKSVNNDFLNAVQQFSDGLKKIVLPATMFSADQDLVTSFIARATNVLAAHEKAVLSAYTPAMQLQSLSNETLEKLRNILKTKIIGNFKGISEDPMVVESCFKRLANTNISSETGETKLDELDLKVKPYDKIIKPFYDLYTVLGDLSKDISAVLQDDKILKDEYSKIKQEFINQLTKSISTISSLTLDGDINSYRLRTEISKFTNEVINMIEKYRKDVFERKSMLSRPGNSIGV